MKKFLTICLLLLSTVSFSQDVISKLINSPKSNIESFMKDHLTMYKLQIDSLSDSTSVEALKYVLQSDSVQTGVLVYLFYYQNTIEDRCTSMRLIFYDEVKFKNNFRILTSHWKKITPYQWYDDRNNLKISTFYAKDKDANIDFYFMDIEPYY